MVKPKCICGCGKPAPHGHHCITQQEIKKHGPRSKRNQRLKDKRNIVPMDWGCHFRHHSGERRLYLDVLPDSVFEFAVEVMEAGPAYEFLRRYYKGADARLDALLEMAA